MNNKLMLSIEEVAEKLGLSRNYAYKLVSNGTLPSVQVGTRKLIPVDALNKWIEANTKGGVTSKDLLGEGG